MSIGISIGVVLGVALGLSLDNLAVGIGAGTAIGAAVGAVLERKNKSSVRPPTGHERKLLRWGTVLGVVALIIFIALFVVLLFLRGQGAL